MGVKRISRGKLFNSEKLGKNVIGDIGVSDGMKDAVVSATQHREGHKVTTDIVLDFGTSKASIDSGNITVNAPCGVSSSANVAICQVTDSVFGIVTQLDAICLEAASDGTTSGELVDFNIITGSANQIKGNAVSSGGVPLGTDSQGATGSLSTLGYQQNLFFDNSALTDKFIFLATGNSTATQVAKGACTITVNTDDADTIVELASKISLRTNDAATGTVVNFSASTLAAFNAAATGLRFQTKNADAAAKIARGIAIGINNHGSFVASPVDGSSATINVNHATLTVFGDQTNPGWIDAPGQTTDIVVSNFTGSAPKKIETGKLLLRFHGFIAPDDI
tara:strand:+ start:313 stop:1320 length:1008 start_codon:yes stop_codon:yes gene_type:complete